MNLKLHEQENLREVFRQSKLFLLKPLGIALLVGVIPWYFLSKYNLADDFKTVLILVGLAALGIFLRKFIIWYDNKYVVTNKRLVVYIHDGLFKRTVIDTPLERVLNVSYKTTGPISALFNYGDVEVQVVGLMDPVILKHITGPEEIKDYLWELHKRVVPDKVQYDVGEVPRYQERLGYTKKNQKIL